MRILSRYLAQEIIRHFGVVLGILTIIFLAVDFFQKIDDFIEEGVPATRAFWYLLFKIPYVAVQMLPISLLLAVLVTFGIMNRRNELIALKSGGVGIFYLVKSVAALGVLFMAFLFCLSEVVVPATMPSANRILYQEVEGGGALATLENKWLPGDHAFFKIGQYNPVDRVMYDFTAYYIDDEFQLVRRLDARRGEFVEEGRWELQNLLVQEFDPKTDTPDVSFYNRRSESIDLTPDVLLQIAPETDEMSCRALRAYIQKIEASGDRATRYRVDLQNKMAFPVVCLIMCLIGTGVAVRSRLKGGLPVIVSFGVGIAFLYFILLYFCVSLGYGGILPPVAAAWAAHFVFLCAGGLVIINAQ